MTKEINLVRSASSTPSISSTSHASYTQLESSQAANSSYQPIMPSPRDPGYVGMGYGHPQGMATYPGYPTPYVQQANGYSSMPYASDFRPDLNPNMPQLPAGVVSYRPPTVYDGPPDARLGLGGMGQGQQGMFTRNLIGSLTASANRLTDPNDKLGIWFVLQDLSVRSEGLFRYVHLPLKPTSVTEAPHRVLPYLSLVSLILGQTAFRFR
jgi:hypothetical protein